jgi:hypothetical protein
MLLLLGTLDLRKKVKLLGLGFTHLEIDPGDTLNRIHEFHQIRNAVAHSSFNPVPAFDRIEDGKKIHYGAGIEFSYIDPNGKLRVPTTARARNRKQKKPKQPSDHLIDEATITFSEFDEYDARLGKIVETLVRFAELVTPINEGINFMQDVAKIIASSDNVLPFVKPPNQR